MYTNIPHLIILCTSKHWFTFYIEDKLKRNYKVMPMEGRIFGKWQVLKRAENDKPGAWYDCLCECGTLQTIPATTLRVVDQHNVKSAITPRNMIMI